MSDVRPGSRIELFYYSDYVKENIHVMRSTVYDRDGKKLLIAQSTPAVLTSGIKKKIVVTYLVKQEGKGARFGFNAAITDLIHDYKLASGEMVAAIVIEQEGPPKPFNIRFHFRLRVPSSSDLTLRIRGEKVTLLDISIGGAMISGAPVKGLDQHERIKVRVSFDDQVYDVEADVLRVWSPSPDGSRSELKLAAIRFVNPPLIFENGLGKAIFKLERQQIAREMINDRR